MKRKTLFLAIFISLASCAILFVVYQMNNINAFALAAIPIPQTEKFDAVVYKIGKYKVWEMQNVYEHNGDYLFAERENGKDIVNRFFMVNKDVKDVDDFAAKFMSLADSGHLSPNPFPLRARKYSLADYEQFSSREIVLKYFFYRESKMLPKYWTPVWNRHCIDELNQHKDDLLFAISIDEKNVEMLK